MNNKIKYCKFCDKEKPEEDFCKSGSFIKNICRECQNKKQRQIYQDSKKTKRLELEIERLNDIINEALGIANERLNYYFNHKSNNEEHLEDWENIFNALVRRDK